MDFFSNKMQYFNISHILWLLIVVGIVLSVFFVFRNKSEKTKYICLISMCVLNIVLYIPYKIVFCATVKGSLILSELPLHLCSFNLILMPIAIATKNKKLFAYFLFVGSWASFAGLLFFGAVFKGMNAYDYVVISYFVYHTLLICISMMTMGFGFYKPKFSDIGWAYMFLVLFACLAHCLNIVLRVSGLSVTANYFITMGDPGNIATDLIMSLIPIPLLYLLPVAVIMFGVTTGIYFLGVKIDKTVRSKIQSKQQSLAKQAQLDTEELLKE